MKLNFSKMCALGNDFIVLNLLDQNWHPTKGELRFLGDRHLGIGCDQILTLKHPDSASADFGCQVFNADGVEVKQCGNGLACLAVFVARSGLVRNSEAIFEIGERLVKTEALAADKAVVALGLPDFEKTQIPLVLEGTGPEYQVSLGDLVVRFGALGLGNPHAIIRTEDIDNAAVAEIGGGLQRRRCFPEGVNVSFCQVVDPGRIRLRVLERGVGETLACGSGACASVLYAHRRSWVGAEVAAELPGGQLQVFCREDGSVAMLGEARHVFSGQVDL